MPGLGRTVERDYAAAERKVLDDVVVVLGYAMVDVYLNVNDRWSNILANVWNYKLGGYRVLKRWLSYRESKVLGRLLLPKEVQHFTDTARRVAAMLGLVRNSSLRLGGVRLLYGRPLYLFSFLADVGLTFLVWGW